MLAKIDSRNKEAALKEEEKEGTAVDIELESLGGAFDISGNPLPSVNAIAGINVESGIDIKDENPMLYKGKPAKKDPDVLDDF